MHPHRCLLGTVPTLAVRVPSWVNSPGCCVVHSGLFRPGRLSRPGEGSFRPGRLAFPALSTCRRGSPDTAMYMQLCKGPVYKQGLFCYLTSLVPSGRVKELLEYSTYSNLYPYKQQELGSLDSGLLLSTHRVSDQSPMDPSPGSAGSRNPLGLDSTILSTLWV